MLTEIFFEPKTFIINFKTNVEKLLSILNDQIKQRKITFKTNKIIACSKSMLYLIKISKLLFNNSKQNYCSITIFLALNFKSTITLKSSISPSTCLMFRNLHNLKHSAAEKTYKRLKFITKDNDLQSDQSQSFDC